jgi:hypothetical protein
MNPLTIKVSSSNGNPMLSGDYVYATEYTFELSEIKKAFTSIVWNFGDGEHSYDSKRVTHKYNYPGNYTITVRAKNNQGDVFFGSENISVDYFIRDQLFFTKIPTEPKIPGIPTKEPYKIQLISAKIKEPLSLVFHAINSGSIPHYVASQHKWEKLVPQWKFIRSDDQTTISSPLTLKTNPIYYGTNIVAVSAEFSFHYVDDTPTIVSNESIFPPLLVVSLSTENFQYPPETLKYPYYSYSNNEVVKAVTLHYIIDVPVTDLKITENLITDVYPVKWTNIPIPVLVTCVFDTNKSLPFFSLLSSMPLSDVLCYPKTNYLGLSSELKLSLSGVPSNLYTVQQSPLYFSSTDKFQNPTRGYIFTTITPLSTISTTCVMASTVVHNETDLDPQTSSKFNFPVGFPIEPCAYISHPFERNINKISITPYTNNYTAVTEFKQQGLLIDGGVEHINFPLSHTLNDTTKFQLSGTTGIYGLAYNPETTTLYAADSDQNILYKISSNNEIAETAVLSSATNSEYNTPTHISIDSEHNVWVSLYDNYTLLKYDKNLTNVLARATPTNISSLELSSLDNATGSPLVAPPIVEVDRENNVWATYTNQISSFIIKYDSNGNQITSSSILSSISNNSNPVSIAINKQNNLWVACEETNEIRFYSSQGVLRRTIPMLSPKYIAIDNDNDLWVLHGYNLYTCIDTKLSLATPNSIVGRTWKLATSPRLKTELVSKSILSINQYPKQLVEESNFNNEIWGGLSVDAFNRIWVIDSENNKIAIFYKNSPDDIRLVQVSPKARKNYYIKPGTDYISEVPIEYVSPTQASGVRSAQASGDWTGNKWLQKFGNKFYKAPVFGKSAPFSVRHLNVNNESKTMEICIPNKTDLTKSEVRAKVTFTGDRLGTLFGYNYFGESAGDWEAIGRFAEGKVYLELFQNRKEISEFEYTLNVKYPKINDQTISIIFPKVEEYKSLGQKDRGVSDVFYFNERRRKDFRITKINNSFDYAGYLKSLALPVTLVQSPSAFDVLISGIAGDAKQFNSEDIGKTVYEKIANFVINHSDVDTAEIKSLKSLADQMSINYKTFGTDFPVEIQQFLDLFSTSKHHFRGTPLYDQNILDNIGSYIKGHDIINSGEILVIKDKFYNKYLTLTVPSREFNYDVFSSTNLFIETGKKILLVGGGVPPPLSSAFVQEILNGATKIEISANVDDIYDKRYRSMTGDIQSYDTTTGNLTANITNLIGYYTSPSESFSRWNVKLKGRTNTNSYPLSSLTVTNLREPFLSHYHFFRYQPYKINGYQSNLIDWNEKLTSISFNLSSNEDWYSDEGIIDCYFNNILTRGLFPDRT